MIWKNEIEEARIILGKESEFITDKSIELMINTFKLIAKILIRDFEKERQ